MSIEKTMCLIKFLDDDIKKAIAGGMDIHEALASLQIVHEKYSKKALAEDDK